MFIKPRMIATLFLLIAFNLSNASVVLRRDNDSFNAREGIFDFGSVHFRSDFSGARLNNVVKFTDSTFQLLIEPENTPINKSSWYGFKAWGDRKTIITITLIYSYGDHRYAPKLSNDGINWRSLDPLAKKVETLPATYRLTISPDTLWVAAQEIINSEHVWNWVDSLAAQNPNNQKEIIGKSSEGRPIVALRIGQSNPRSVLVVLSRQHPPEVTGQLAMKAFIEEMYSGSEQAKAFLERYSIILIPLINPDGVEHGHWRHNMRGADLNRDWSQFEQPETRSVKLYLERQVALGDTIVFALDFHSTKTDVFYVVTDDETSLTNHWISALSKTLPEARINKSFHGLESATSKNWIQQRFGAEAVTYEVGDETDRPFLKRLGKTAASCLQTELINRHAATIR